LRRLPPGEKSADVDREIGPKADADGFCFAFFVAKVNWSSICYEKVENVVDTRIHFY
jgi:hypothetical protein